MSHVTIILVSLLMLALVAIMAPNIIAFNRGKILRNIAIWLAILVILGLVYQNFGPESQMPLLGTYGTMNHSKDDGSSPAPADDSDKVDDSSQKGDQGFTPPRE